MAMQTSRFLAAVVVLLVGVAIGATLAARGAFDKLFTPSGVRAVVVGPDPARLSIGKLRISKDRADVVFWAARRKDDRLFIEFEDEVFEGMEAQANGRYRVQCAGRTCYSREIKGAYGDFKYWQILIGPDGTPREADGRIIIDR
jgi:hypothetical protein